MRLDSLVAMSHELQKYKDYLKPVRMSDWDLCEKSIYCARCCLKLLQSKFEENRIAIERRILRNSFSKFRGHLSFSACEKSIHSTKVFKLIKNEMKKTINGERKKISHHAYLFIPSSVFSSPPTTIDMGLRFCRWISGRPVHHTNNKIHRRPCTGFRPDWDDHRFDCEKSSECAGLQPTCVCGLWCRKKISRSPTTRLYSWTARWSNNMRMWAVRKAWRIWTV